MQTDHWGKNKRRGFESWQATKAFPSQRLILSYIYASVDGDTNLG